MSASDAQIADALAYVLEPAPDHETHLLDVYGAVRKRLASVYFTDASVRDVKRVMRAAGVRTRTPTTATGYGPQLAVGVRLLAVARPPVDEGDLNSRIQRALKP